MRIYVYSGSCPAYWNPPVDSHSGFRKPDSQYTSGLLEKPASALTAKSVIWNKNSGPVFSKVWTISNCFHRSSLNINFCISQELWSKKNVKPISCPAESTNLIFQKLKCNPISGETVPLKTFGLFLSSLAWREPQVAVVGAGSPGRSYQTETKTTQNIKRS